MRGGFLCFQAQYLRRIRVPYWADVPPALRVALVAAAELADDAAAYDAVSEIYGLSEAEREALGADLGEITGLRAFVAALAGHVAAEAARG